MAETDQTAKASAGMAGVAVESEVPRPIARGWAVFGDATLRIAEQAAANQLTYDLRTSGDYPAAVKELGTFIHKYPEMFPDFMTVVARTVPSDSDVLIARVLEFPPQTMMPNTDLSAPPILSHREQEFRFAMQMFNIAIEFTNQSLRNPLGWTVVNEQLAEIPETERRTLRMMFLTEVVHNRDYHRNLLSTMGHQTFATIADALDDSRWIGLLHRENGLQLYNQALQREGMSFRHFVLPAGAAASNVFMNRETAYFLRGAQYLEAMRDPVKHQEAMLPGGKVVWESGPVPSMSNISSDPYDPLAGILRWGDYALILGTERYQTARFHGHGEGYRNGKLLSTQVIDLRLDEWAEIKLLDVLRHSGRWDVENGCVDREFASYFTGGFGWHMSRNPQAQDPYWWRIGPNDVLLKASGEPLDAATSAEMRNEPMLAKFWGDLDEGSVPPWFDTKHPEGAAQLIREMIGAEQIAAIEESYKLAAELAAPPLGRMSPAEMARMVGNADAAIGAQVGFEFEQNEIVRIWGACSELGLWALQRPGLRDSAQRDALGAAVVAVWSALDRDIEIAAAAWPAKRAFYHAATKFYPGIRKFMAEHALSWLYPDSPAAFGLSESDLETMQFFALFYADTATYPTFLIQADLEAAAQPATLGRLQARLTAEGMDGPRLLRILALVRWLFSPDAATSVGNWLKVGGAPGFSPAILQVLPVLADSTLVSRDKLWSEEKLQANSIAATVAQDIPREVLAAVPLSLPAGAPDLAKLGNLLDEILYLWNIQLLAVGGIEIGPAERHIAALKKIDERPGNVVPLRRDLAESEKVAAPPPVPSGHSAASFSVAFWRSLSGSPAGPAVLAAFKPGDPLAPLKSAGDAPVFQEEKFAKLQGFLGSEEMGEGEVARKRTRAMGTSVDPRGRTRDDLGAARDHRDHVASSRKMDPFLLQLAEIREALGRVEPMTPDIAEYVEAYHYAHIALPLSQKVFWRPAPPGARRAQDVDVFVEARPLVARLARQRREFNSRGPERALGRAFLFSDLWDFKNLVAMHDSGLMVPAPNVMIQRPFAEMRTLAMLAMNEESRTFKGAHEPRVARNAETGKWIVTYEAELGSMTPPGAMIDVRPHAAYNGFLRGMSTEFFPGDWVVGDPVEHYSAFAVDLGGYCPAERITARPVSFTGQYDPRRFVSAVALDVTAQRELQRGTKHFPGADYHSWRHNLQALNKDVDFDPQATFIEREHSPWQDGLLWAGKQRDFNAKVGEWVDSARGQSPVLWDLPPPLRKILSGQEVAHHRISIT